MHPGGRRCRLVLGGAAVTKRSADTEVVLEAAREIDKNYSRGENGKARRPGVERYLSHPQFCSMGSVAHFDKAAFNANFDAIFGSTPPPPNFGQREGYVVKPLRARPNKLVAEFEASIREDDE